MADDWESKYKQLKCAVLCLAADLDERAMKTAESAFKLSPADRKATEYASGRIRMCADSIRNTVSELDTLPLDAEAGQVESAVIRAQRQALAQHTARAELEAQLTGWLSADRDDDGSET